MAEIGLLLEAGAAALLAVALTLALRRPRLHLEASLRGSTRDGKLYLVLSNRGHMSARGLRVQVAWTRPDGARSSVETRELDLLAPRDVARLEMRELHALLPDDAQGWTEIEVEVRARNALKARATLQLKPRAKDPEPPAVIYAAASTLPCRDAPDGRHAFEMRPYLNDGVTERWHVCARCRHVVREPLTPEEQATQARIRKARMEEMRRRMEAEFAERAAREEPRPHAGAWRRARPGRERDDRARDVDTFPPELAFFLLGLDPKEATWPDVVSAHRRLALENHPDRQHGRAPDARAMAERAMQEINGARDRLREHFGVRARTED